MTPLLLLSDLLNDGYQLQEPESLKSGNVDTCLDGRSPTQHQGHTPTDDEREVCTQPLHMDRDTRTQSLHMDRDTHTQSLHTEQRRLACTHHFQGRDTYALTRECHLINAGIPDQIGAAPLGRMNYLTF